jgi:hypothetical protein
MLFQTKTRVMAADLVNRARLGDQNAIAGIAVCKHYADLGEKKFVKLRKAVREYIEAHPVEDEGTQIGEEVLEAVRTLKDTVQKGEDGAQETCAVLLVLPNGGSEALCMGATVLADGPPLTDQRIRKIGRNIQDEGRRGLFFRSAGAVPLCVPMVPVILEMGREEDRVGQSVIQAGRCVAMARGFQCMRVPNFPLTHLDPTFAWEFGD